MTMARAKRRAVSATTDASAAPSRRCRCQSSGRVRRELDPSAEFYFARSSALRYSSVLRRAGDARRQLRRFARRAALPAGASSTRSASRRSLGCAARRRARAPARTRPAAGAAPAASHAGAAPSGRRATSSNFFVSSRAIAISRSGAEALGKVRQRLEHAVRRFVEDHRPWHVEGRERLAPRRARCGQEAGEQEARGGEARSRTGGGRRAGPGQRAHADAGAVRFAHQQRARIGQRRRAGVADQRDGLSLAQRGNQLCAGARARCARAARRCARRCRGARAACAWCACPRRR